uniref:Uncharacterized protein n=1 Tax=Cucumis melo TaxID=3656 RepID=A0A9I9EBN1_CUCME
MAALTWVPLIWGIIVIYMIELNQLTILKYASPTLLGLISESNQHFRELTDFLYYRLRESPLCIIPKLFLRITSNHFPLLLESSNLNWGPPYRFANHLIKKMASKTTLNYDGQTLTNLATQATLS